MLAPIRPESKFFAHLIMAFLNKTKDFYNTELLLMPAKRNKWNEDLVSYISRKEPSIRFIDEPVEEKGQRGHHIYMNELAKHAKGDWIMNFCDDMDILLRDWDEVIREFIRSKELDPEQCFMIIPTFEVAGAVEHILSRGWLETVGCNFNYPNGDSWLNTVVEKTPEIFKKTRVLSLPTTMFEDYSHKEQYFHLFESTTKGETKEKEDWNSPEVQSGIWEASKKLFEAFENGR